MDTEKNPESAVDPQPAEGQAPPSDVDETTPTTTAISAEDAYALRKEQARRRAENKELRSELEALKAEKAEAEKARLEADGQTEELLKLERERSAALEGKLRQSAIESKARKAMASAGIVDPARQKALLPGLMSSMTYDVETGKVKGSYKASAKALAKTFGIGEAKEPEKKSSEQIVTPIIATKPQTTNSTEARPFDVTDAYVRALTKNAQ
jgi:hypothetical protein